MEPLFKNLTKYTEKNYNQFIEFHQKNFGFSYNSYTIIMTILLILCIILNIVKMNVLFILLFAGILTILLLYRIYFPTKKHQKSQQQYKNLNETSYTFSFYKLYFTLNETTIYYFNLYKVFETKDYFYLYVNNENAAMVSKHGFKIGNADEFSEFIKKKCLFKYSKQI